MAFEGKVVLITGASSGIGAGVALYLASKKSSLVLTGRNEANLMKIGQECANRGNHNVLTVVVDLTKEADVQRLMDETIAKFGKLDVLVNNAGIVEFGSIKTSCLAQLDRIFAVNIRAVYQLTMLAVPFLLKSRGSIVNVSSCLGTLSLPQCLAYCMSKSALDQMTKCVALELAPMGVRVNSVNPGVIDTEIFVRSGMDEAAKAQLLEDCKKSHPLGRSGVAGEVAAVIAFLASEEASFVTGELLHIDGGVHLTSSLRL